MDRDKSSCLWRYESLDIPVESRETRASISG